MALHLEVVSLDESLFSGHAYFVVLPGLDGDLGVYPQHTRLLGLLRAGSVRIQLEQDGDFQDIVVAGGIFDIQPTQVLILADKAVRLEEEDLASVEAARDNVMNKLATVSEEEKITIELELSLLQAQIAALRRIRRR